MDGQVNNTTGAAGSDEGREREATGAGAADCSGHSDPELVSLARNLEHLGNLDDDLEQPDGQRSSLSLEDDGGTHFEPHSQETVIRRGMTMREREADSPTQQEGSDDNDVAFNPAQKLNFDDGEEEEDDDNEDSLEVTGDVFVNNLIGNREYIFQRPLVNGSDMAELGAYGGLLTAQDQGQNVRIIEGHDSSLLDDGGNSTFGFNFLQTQMINIPPMSPGNLSSGLGNNGRQEDEAHNLYDSLEREDGSSLYGETDDHVMESNTSEYFSAGSMSLVVANSQLPDCDSLWAQDDSSDHGNYLPHHQNFLGGQGIERPLRHHSPPRNFQGDSSSIFVPKRRSVLEGNMGGYGDVHSTEEDNTDVLTLELSEEGLSHTTQMYAQPVSANNGLGITNSIGSSACKGDTGTQHQSHNDWTTNKLFTQKGNQLFLFDNAVKLVHQAPSNSQPKNLIWSQGLSKDESSHIEGDGIDLKSDERQSGAGNFSTSNHKHTGDSNQSGRRSVTNKIQTRRPAVQGSASSGDKKRLGNVNSRQGSVPHRKVIPPAKSGSHNDTSGRNNSAVSRLISVGDQVKGNNAGTSSSGNFQSRAPQGQASAFSMASRSNSHTSLASNTSSTNSRVGGVGKESHMSTNPQALVPRGVAPPGPKIEPNHPMTMAQRLAGVKGDTARVLAQPTNPGHGIPQQHQLSNPSDKVGLQPEPHKSQSFIKQRSTMLQSQNPPSHDDNNMNDPQNYEPGDAQVAQHSNETQNHSSNGVIGSSSYPQNQIHQQHYQPQQPPHQSEYQAYGNQQVSQQNSQAGFSAYSQECSPSGSEGSHHSSRDVPVTQVEAFRRQGLKPPSRESNSQCSNLDNDIQGMEEVRSHLHSMLNMGAELSISGHSGQDHAGAPVEAFFLDHSQVLVRQPYFDSDTSSFIGNNHQEDMSDILENFPTFSSKMFSHMPGMSTRSDVVNHGENQYLRECLEKEKYRRKHCEEHIQKQNTKLLELQQQLAVAVSTDKRKDLMIEQLDKQLAKVVEGWKKRETEKEELIKVLSQEKEQLEETLQNQHTIISGVQRELSQTSAALREERERSADMINNLKTELDKARQEKESLEGTLKEERDKHADMKAEWDDLKQSKELAEQRAQKSQERLLLEQENGMKKDKELLAKITELQEASQRNLNMEKVKFEEQKKKREEAEAENEEMKAELKKVVLDMEQLIREKESQKVEVAIMEAKFESAQRKLETDLHAQMEKEIADQAAELHARIEASLEEAANHHRKQVAEIQNRHQQDMDRQAATFNEERQRKEDEYRKQLNELEEKLQELRAENLSLGQSKIKLESQRMEILTKLQFMMQSQWNEAVSLLVTTPQKKSLNSSFLSSQSSSQQASVTAVADSNTSVTGHNLMTSVQSALRGQDVEGHGQAGSGSPKLHPAVSASVLEKRKDERQEEIDRMDRVEEYLQRLPPNMGIPFMRSIIPGIRNELQNSEMSQSSGPDDSAAVVPNNSAGHSFSNTVLSLQHHISTLGSGQEMAGDDFNIKASNNLSHSHGAHIHSYVTGENGQAFLMSSGHLGSGHVTRTDARFQAVAMRSPQQSSSRYSTDSNLSHPAKAMPNHPSAPTSQHFVYTTQPDQGFAHPHHQRYHTHHHHEQKPQPSPQQSHLLHAKSGSYGSEMRPLAGDFGDNKEVKLPSGSAGNVNLYRPDSPTYISNPSSIPPIHWSHTSSMPAQHFPSVPSLASAMASSPGPDAAARPLYNMESPVKRHKPRPGQIPNRSIDGQKESLSPPVKQKAERENSDTTSNASSSCVDANRLLASYSQLSERMEEHQSRQGELQHYVRMLLQKAPGSMCSEPERDQQLSDPEILDSSRDLTDLDLNDTATMAELTSQLTRLQHLRELQSSRVNPPRNPIMQQAPKTSQSNESILSNLSEFIEDTDIISSQRLSEISAFLNMYRDSEKPGQTNVAGQLLDVLKDASVSASTENISRQEEKRSGGSKDSPKPHQARKVKDLTKTRKIRTDSQSADSSFALSGYSLEHLASNKSVIQGPPRKVSQPTETTKDKKSGSVKQPVNRAGGAPAWK